MTAIQTARGHGSRRRLHPRSKKSPRRMLLAQIRDARSKAYGLDAIAKILSESGVTASASLVRDRLTEANAPLVSGLDGPSKSARLRKSPVAGSARPAATRTVVGRVRLEDGSGSHSSDDSGAKPSSSRDRRRRQPCIEVPVGRTACRASVDDRGATRTREPLKRQPE
jgi:hypothetical protein